MNSATANVIKTWVKVFAFGALGVLATFKWDVFSINSDGWKAVVVGGIAALGCFIVTALDPTDSRYGINKTQD